MILNKLTLNEHHGSRERDTHSYEPLDWIEIGTPLREPMLIIIA